MANDLFVGEAKGHLSGAGSIAIHSQRNPDVTCTGQFTSSAERGGLGTCLLLKHENRRADYLNGWWSVVVGGELGRGCPPV